MTKIYSFLIVAIVFASNVMAQNIPNYVPKDGLVGYWPFNGNANDESGNGNHGTVNGATLTADRNGKVNSAYSFNGLSNYVQLGPNDFNAINILDNNNFTVSFWVNDLKGASTYFMNFGWGVHIYNSIDSLKPTFGHVGIWPDNKWYNVTSKSSIKLNNWYHIVAVKNNNLQYIYINGVLNGTSTSTPAGLGDKVYIGGNPIDNNGWTKGFLDDYGFWSRALTEQEISALYTGVLSNNIKIGDVKYGGKVAYILKETDPNYDSNKIQGIISALNDLEMSPWGCYNKTLNGPLNSKDQPFSLELGGGRLNTDSIISQCKDINSAALKCSNFVVDSYSDWYLPSVEELRQLYKNKDIIGGFKSDNYWTSTQDDIPNGNSGIFAWRLDFKDGNTHTTGSYKNNSYNIRPIRYFSENKNGLSSTKVFVDAPATVNQNETVELSISTEALNTSDNVIAFQTDFSYDTTRYTYVGNNVVGTLNPNGTVDVNTAKKGVIKLGYMSQTALSGAGSLVKLKFKANDKVGQGIFGLSNFLFNTTNITSLKSDTVNTLDVTPPTAKLTYSVNPARKGDSLLITVNFSEKMAVSPVPQINLTGQNTLANSNLTKVNDSTYTYWWVVEKGNGAVNVNLATGTDLAGNVIIATPTQNPSFTVLPTVFGDIDTNKLVQAYDAALALQYSVGLNPLPIMDPLPWSNWRLAVANVDTVGSVTANDASLILQHSIGKISSFPADAKKRGGEAPTADVTVKREGNQLVFRTTGTLYAFNGYFKDNFNAFGQPEIKDKNAMVATNINATTYNVGLASSTPFTVNEPFLIIPIVASTDIAGTIDIVANTQEKALTYSSAAVASINEAMTTTMNVYPNPTKDVVTVTNAQGKTLRIVDFEGRIVSTQAITNNTHEVSLKSIGSKGEYIFQLLGENDETITTQKVVMQ